MEYSTKSLISRLLNEYVSKYYLLIVFSILSMLLVAATTGANAYLIQPMLDQIFVSQQSEMLYVLTFAVFSVAIVKGFASYFQTIAMKTLGQKILTDMQIKLYNHLLHADMKLINTYSSGKLISSFTNDISVMRATVSTIITGVARDLFSVVILIGVMFYQNWLLALFAFTVFPIAIYPIIRLGKRMKKIAGHTQEELSNYTSRLDESFKNLKVIKSYNREEFEVDRAHSMISKILNLYIKAARVESLSSPIMESLSGFAIAFVIWYGGSQVIEGVTTAGSFFSFIAATLMAYKPIKTLTDLNTSLQEGLAAAARFFALMDTKPTIVDSDISTDLIVDQGEIIFEGIDFNHQDREKLFEKFCLNIPCGKTVAIVGESGGGKSTLINLLFRFVDPQYGKILIDGQDIKAATLKSLRNTLTLVTQEVSLFDESILNNIKYGKLESTEHEVEEAAQLSLITEFTKMLPQGLNTKVGQSGVHLSGGQRQRVAIARAILKNSPILVLDEATSALDAITENEICSNLKKIRQNKTTIIIAHRLSTIIDADIIFVLSAGKLIEKGKHDELLANKGYYHQLYQKYGLTDD
ncbi:ABC transporter ATP-binding protein [Rickettsiales endosymbiont of Stachyamoeba lipophora]|uniref:ABC transporter ATP-binding protein n=1 Tax=Rickettsiales endosymbiont of Stachyamoeba lipophora TaxID=2486578 RepID=UPI000F6459C0|nr:ABC transporter ATP-binding protein [Rickettsiales endosymbiont of Stachyamoeba lipophora]AZL15021.1 ABC transporter ATP-binding protein [Rickettsiales endosymbiont of Stachyamoeba lipophora]